MQRFVIEGGRPLRGNIHVGGSKNAVLPMMAASLLCDGPVTLRNVPRLVDVATMRHLLIDLGASADWTAAQEVRICSDGLRSTTATYDIVRRMRASVCVLGPLLARFGYACVSLPGGCNIGVRPIDVHLRGLAAMGADIQIENGYVVARCKHLKPALCDMSAPGGTTVTGTANLMMAAALTPGTTVLQNAAREPEIAELARMLRAAGADISGVDDGRIEITGRQSLQLPDPIEVIPDRIEAATLVIAAAITRGHVTIENAPISHLTAVLESLSQIGVACETTPLGLTVHVPGDMQATTFSATPYPGLPTDVQAQFMALLATVPGVSRVTDTVFPDRFIHAAELVRMGADIQVQAGTAVIHGVSQLSGAAVMASDLRASAALVLGALAARGRSEILRVYHLDRGYAAFDQTLIQLGADVRRLDEAGRTESVRAGTPFPDAPIADTTIPARNISSGDSLRSPVPAPHLQSLSLDSSENYSGRTQQTHVSTANPPKNLSFENNGPFDDSSEKTDP